jgi:hypothetical protein
LPLIFTRVDQPIVEEERTEEAPKNVEAAVLDDEEDAT